MNLTGKKVIITGASSGIGVHLQNHNEKVGIVYVHRAPAGPPLALQGNAWATASPVVLDITMSPAVSRGSILPSALRLPR